MVGTNRVYIYRLENKIIKNYDKNILYKISEVLGLDYEELLKNQNTFKNTHSINNDDCKTRSNNIKKIYNFLIKNLKDNNRYNECFEQLVNDYISLLKTKIKLEEIVNCKGIDIYDNNGNLKINPALREIDKKYELMLKILDKLNIKYDADFEVDDYGL